MFVYFSSYLIFALQRLQCQCLHNTMGDNCEKCLPLFNQKPWQVGGIQNMGCEGQLLLWNILYKNGRELGLWNNIDVLYVVTVLCIMEINQAGVSLPESGRRLLLRRFGVYVFWHKHEDEGGCDHCNQGWLEGTCASCAVIVTNS